MWFVFSQMQQIILTESSIIYYRTFLSEGQLSWEGYKSQMVIGMFNHGSCPNFISFDFGYIYFNI